MLATSSAPYKQKRVQILKSMKCENHKLYEFMKKNEIEKIEIGLVVNIEDYMCNVMDEGYSSNVIGVYATLEEAEKHRYVYDNDGDIEDCEMDMPIPLYIYNDEQKEGYIRFDMDYLVVLDGIYPYDIYKDIPTDKIIEKHSQKNSD